MEKFLFYRIPLRENIVYFQKKKQLDELLSMENKILKVRKLSYQAGRYCYLEGPLAEYPAAFECRVWQGRRAELNGSAQNLVGWGEW